MSPTGAGRRALAVRILLVSLAAVAAAVTAPLFLAGCGSARQGQPSASRPAPGTGGTPGAQAPAPLSPITGMTAVKPGSPVAVSVDNYKLARPQSGLAQADLVYEVLAEGGITRYLAIFYGQAPSVVGPVRSARPYFALLAKEWGAVFAHCGGDPKDLQPVREWSVVDGDEFTHGSLYWRDDSRTAPHDLYTSVDNLRKVPVEPLPAPAKRYEFQDWAGKPAQGLQVRYGQGYAVEYTYAGKCYERVISDGDQEPVTCTDRETEEKVRVSNVIVQYAKTQVAYSDGGLIIDLISEGKAAYLLGGRYSEGTWKKESLGQPTLFYTSAGSKIVLTPGQTWVQIVPEDAQVSVTETR